MKKAFKTIVPVLDELSKMSSKTLVIDADQIITSKLLPVKSLIPKPRKLVDEQFAALEGFLLKILKVNNGQLSMQCSIRIADCLLALYSDHRTNQIWNLVTVFKKSPRQSNTYALGYILNKIGHSCKSMINGLAGSIISLNDKLLIPQIFALCACIKSSAKDVDQFADKMFAIAKKHLLVPNEPVQLLCLKLLRKLLKSKLVNVDKVVPLIHQLLENQIMPYIIDQAALVVATMAVVTIKSPIVQSKDVSDVEFAKASFDKERKAINDDVKKSLNILGQFKGHVVESFTKYLSLLSPAFVNFIRKDLFTFARKSAPRAVPQLISLFGVDVRKEIFTEVAKEQASSEQLTLLGFLSFDMSTLTEAAGLAMQLAQKKVSKTRSEGSQFYNILVERDPELAQSFLRTSALYLATPPEDSPTISAELRGMALICASILTAVPNKKYMISLVEGDLVKFLKNAWKCESVLDKFYQPAFILMSALPRKYVRKEEIDRLMSLYLQYILMNEVKTEEEISMASMIGEAVALFISVHPDFESTMPVIGCIFEQSYLLTNVVQACIFQAYSSLKADNGEMIKLANMLKAVVLKGSPDPAYGSRRVAHPLITRTSILNFTENTPHELYDVFVHASGTDVAYRVLKAFPEFVMAIPESERGQWVKSLVTTTEKPMMQMNLLLSLAQDERAKSSLPQNFHELMLAKLETITRMDIMQLATECISVWLRSFPKHISDVIKAVTDRKDKAKCMMYSSMCAHNDLPDDTIITILLDLNEMAKVDDLTPYALFAISSVFLSYPKQLASIPFVDGQANFILSILCSNRSLDPFVLFHCGNCLKALLPIISPNMEKKRPLMVPVVKQIMQMISLTIIPYSKQTLSYVMHAVFTYAKELGSYIQLEFPKSVGTSLSYHVEACRAFADMLVITSTQDDYFNLIPRLLLLLQRTQHPNPTQLVLAIAQNFAANAKDVIREQSIRDRILEWTRLMKLCLSAGNLPDTGSAKIGATLPVKLCLLQVAKELLPLVAASEPLITESLDDIMTCLTRAIDSRNPKMHEIAFPLLVQVIDSFKDKKNDTENSSVLELYDIQFSTAVKFGFTCLDVSSDMVGKYLDFHLKNVETRVEPFLSVLSVFVSGLANCENKNHAYYNVAARLCIAASKHSEIYGKMEQYLPRFVQEFADIIFAAVKLWNSGNEAEISEFRTGFSGFFGDLLTAFIWAQALLKEDIIKPANFVEFLIGEVTDKRNEDWRVVAAFESMTALIHFYPSEKKLTHRMVSKMVNAVSEAYKRRSKLLRPTITRFMLESSERIKPKDEQAWNELISLLVDDNFHATILCYLMRNGDQETVTSYASQFSDVIYENFVAGKCSHELAIALFTMLFYIASQQMPKLLSWVLDIKDKRKENIIKFKFAFVDKLLRFIPASKENHYTKKFSKGLSHLVWSNFDNGGLDLAVHIITRFPLLGKSLIDSDFVTEYTNDCFDRLDSVNRFFQFIHFVIGKFDPAENDMDNFVMLSIRFVFRCIIQWGDNRANSKSVVIGAAQILNVIKESSEPLIRVVFKSMGDEFQETAIEYVEKYTLRAKARKNSCGLVFGGGASKRRKRTMGDDSDDDQWETL